jgi:hypothetical protein
MADILDALKYAGADEGSGPVDIKSALDAANDDEAPAASNVAPVTKGGRFVKGLTDMPTSAGQLVEHIPGAETGLNGVRWAIRKGLGAAGMPDAASLFENVSTDDFDNLVSTHEQEYQQARAAAGNTGIDWWRLGGNVAGTAPLAVGGSVASSVLGRVGQGAAQGGLFGVVGQPSNSPGSFWWDKVKGGATGAVLGAGTSAAVEGLSAGIRAGIAAIRRIGAPSAAAAGPQADALVNRVIQESGTDPASLNPNVLAGLKQEAHEALTSGVEPNAQAVLNRARAESLPVPVNLMRGQATGDAMLFSQEQNLRGVQGVGEPLTARLSEQENAFKANLDALGAKNAPDRVYTGNWLAEKVQGAWDSMQDAKDAAYKAVRNSRGQPAALDQFTAVDNIKAALDTPQASHAFDLLPSHIRQTIDDLADGKLDLTVAQMQQLDKAWGQAERGSADGSVRNAISVARRHLNDAPVSDELGEEARTAYQQARQMHAQQMSLIDPKLPNGRPNPNFQPLFKGVIEDGKPPETLFQSHFFGAAPSVAAKNLEMVGKLDPSGKELIGRTLMGEIKAEALNDASEARGAVSSAKLTQWANDPVKSARLDALMPAPQADTFRNLAATVEAAKKPPVASTVNTSNTGSTLVNQVGSMIKNGVLTQVGKRLPVVKQVVDPFVEGSAAARTQGQVSQALKPGVTLKQLMSASPSEAFWRSNAARVLIPGVAVASSADKSNEPPP